MTIDEAIVHAREVASRKFDDRVHCIRCAEEHEQLAEWLEELKAYRANEGISENVYRFGYKFGYNKAVDDTIKSIKEEYVFTILEEEKIDEIAEQLKGAKQSEDFKQEEIQQTH